MYRWYILLLYSCVYIMCDEVNLFVNRVEQLCINEPFTTYINKSDIYRYVAGHRIDVECISQTPMCVVEIQYKDAYNDEYSMLNKHHYYNGVGLRTTLERIHDHTHLSCEFSCAEHKIRLEIEFLLQNSIEDTLNFRINDYTIIFQHPAAVSQYYVYYISDEELTFVHHSNTVNVKVFSRNGRYASYKQITNHTIKIAPINYYELKYELLKQYQFTYIHIYFKKLDKSFKDETPLMINATDSSLQLYQHRGDQDIYYAYEDEESITFKCETLPGLVSPSRYRLRFGGKGAWAEDYRIVSIDNFNPVNCSLKDTNFDVIRQIHLYFHKKISSTTIASTTGSGGDFPTWVFPVIGGVVCIVVMSVLIIVCYMKRRSRRVQKDLGSDSFHNQLVDNDSPSSPDTCQHQPLYSAPMAQRYDDTTYSEVRVHRPGGSHCAPTSVSRSQAGGTPELNYAVLDISPSVRFTKKPGVLESPYAEVFCNVTARVEDN